MAHTFFTIFVPRNEDPRTWAKQMWDTYGFDYDTTKFGAHSVCAWALEEGEEDELREALDEDDIYYEEFEVEDLNAFFGLDQNDEHPVSKNEAQSS